MLPVRHGFGNLEVTAQNEGAIRLYRGLGFRPQSRRLQASRRRPSIEEQDGDSSSSFRGGRATRSLPAHVRQRPDAPGRAHGARPLGGALLRDTGRRRPTPPGQPGMAGSGDTITRRSRELDSEERPTALDSWGWTGTRECRPGPHAILGHDHRQEPKPAWNYKQDIVARATNTEGRSSGRKRPGHPGHQDWRRARIEGHGRTDKHLYPCAAGATTTAATVAGVGGHHHRLAYDSH